MRDKYEYTDFDPTYKIGKVLVKHSGSGEKLKGPGARSSRGVEVQRARARSLLEEVLQVSRGQQGVGGERGRCQGVGEARQQLRKERGACKVVNE